MCWLFPTTCLFITTLSMGGERGDWTRRKVGPSAIWAEQADEDLHKLPHLNSRFVFLSRSGESTRDCVLSEVVNTNSTHVPMLRPPASVSLIQFRVFLFSRQIFRANLSL